MYEDDTPWWHQGRCRGQDESTLIFYPPRDKTQYRTLAAQAKTFCFGENKKNPCPVQKECLWDALDRKEPHGIWGGYSHRERNALVRKWQKKFKKQMTLKEFIFRTDKD